MSTVTISRRFQISIPKAVREAMGLTQGMQLQVLHFNDRIELVPVRTPPSLRGSLRGIDTTVPREPG